MSNIANRYNLVKCSHNMENKMVTYVITIYNNIKYNNMWIYINIIIKYISTAY